jgi:mono/diheme cytochrome c family protein
MAKTLAGILLIAGIALGGWALLGMNQTQDETMQAASASIGGLAAADNAPAESPAADEATQEGTSAPAAGASPLETARTAEKGTLTNPYTDYEAVAKEGHQIYMAAGCNGCHGGGGGGGMGPPLTNVIWIYGKDDDTLFRLTALGTDELQQQGYARKGSEAVVGPMPPFGEIVKSNDDLWKIIAWIRSKNPSSVEQPPS